MKIAIIGAGFTGCLLANFLDSPDIEVSILKNHVAVVVERVQNKLTGDNVI
jgi:2-polyprenyl-6-methoxyphenol hydroxylase-like FAD-dependent oxidoreductase